MSRARDIADTGDNNLDDIVVDGSGNVIIGNTTVDSATSTTIYSSGQIRANTSSTNAVILDRRDSDGSILEFKKDDSSVGSIGNNTDFYVASADGMGARFTNNQILPCDENGATQNGSRDLGSSSGRFKDLYLSGGVYLGGTGSANKLDDYEEGTWTPTNAGDSTGTIGVASAGQYTKIGRLVHVQAQLQVTANFTGNTFGGLPFTPRIESGLSNVFGGFNAATASGTVYLSVTDSNNNINVYSNLVNTGLAPNVTHNVFRFAFTYETNA